MRKLSANPAAAAEPAMVDAPTARSAARSAAPSAAPSIIGRVIAILDLFGKQRLSIGVDDIATALGLSSASAYRYASELLVAGLLVRDASGYRLGPKIIELEYLIRSFDPVLRAGEELMQAIARRTGHDVLLCNVYGETIVNVLHIPGVNPVRLTYTKGLPMPLFRGAQAKVVLASMDRRRLKRVFERSIVDPALTADVRKIGADWPTFAATLKAIRQQGHHVARGELDHGVVGIAAPVLGADDGILGSLVVTVDARSTSAAEEKALVALVIDNAARLSTRIAELEAAVAS